jgi:hypothetical protein
MKFRAAEILVIDGNGAGGIILTPDAAARERMIARFDRNTTRPEWALGYASGIMRRAAPAQLEAAGTGLECLDSCHPIFRDA